LSNGVPKEKIEEITYKWRNNEILLQRIKSITKKYQEAKDIHSDKHFISDCVANYLLEGINDRFRY